MPTVMQLRTSDKPPRPPQKCSNRRPPEDNELQQCRAGKKLLRPEIETERASEKPQIMLRCDEKPSPNDNAERLRLMPSREEKKSRSSGADERLPTNSAPEQGSRSIEVGNNIPLDDRRPVITSSAPPRIHIGVSTNYPSGRMRQVITSHTHPKEVGHHFRRSTKPEDPYRAQPANCPLARCV